MATTLTVLDINGGDAGSFELDDACLEREKGQQAVHDSVVAYLAGQRAGTAKTKTRAEIAGTGSKPYRQKGTGRARAGSGKSPIWRGGGTVFGPIPRDFSKRTNRKVERLALKRSFTERLDAEEVIVVDEVRVPAPKTREMVAFLRRVGADADALVLVDDINPDVAVAARNLPRVLVVRASTVNPYLMLQFGHVVISKAGLEALGKRLAP